VFLYIFIIIEKVEKSIKKIIKNIMDYSNITELDLSNKGLIKLPDLSIYINLKN